jgi:hypothetical protein
MKMACAAKDRSCDLSVDLTEKSKVSASKGEGGRIALEDEVVD